MRRFLFIFLLLSFSINAQVFTENFDSGLPNSWTISNNGVGLSQSWVTSPATFGNNGSLGAMIANETGTITNPVQDWLISPQINLNAVANPQLRFFGRTIPIAPNRNSVLKIMVSTTGTNFSDFQLIETYTETFTGAINPISPNANFNQQILDLNVFGNSTIYLAFVMENVGVGKTWLIDDVEIFDQCVDVTDIEIEYVSEDSFFVTWQNPGESNYFQLELVSGNNAPTGIPTHTSTIPNYIFENLLTGVNYKVFIRSLCTDLYSDWVVSDVFELLPLGSGCQSAIPINTLPYFTSDNTVNYQNNFSGSPGTGCGINNEFDWEAIDYLYGNDVVYSITPTSNIVVDIKMNIAAPYSGFFVYNECADIGVSCIAGSATNTSNPRIVNNLNLVANTTYYILVSSSSFAFPNQFEYTLSIQQVNCQGPNSLNASLLTSNSASLSWNNDVSITTSAWEIVVQDGNLGLPLSSGLSINQQSYLAQQTTTGNNLLPGTLYEFYVRAACGDGNFSPWIGPHTFTTACESFNVPFFEGFNSDSPTEICWSVVGLNDVSNSWDLDFLYDTFEGDQVARLTSNDLVENATNDDWLISPRFNINGQYRLKYHYKVGTYDGLTQSFEVKMSTTNTDLSSFNQMLVPLENYSNNEFQQKIVYLPLTTGEVNLAWHVSNDAQADVFIDNIILESVPSCSEPFDLTVFNPTQTTLTVDWGQFGNVSSWDVIAIPSPGTITDDLTGITIYNTITKPFVIPDLISSTLYNIYVRSHCSVNETSEWSNLISYYTIPSNDECINSISVPVNLSNVCEVVVPGSLIGATTSDLGDVCFPFFETKDVWFDFTAQNQIQLIKLIDMSPEYQDVYIVVYSGNCTDGLTQIGCSQSYFGGGDSILFLNDLIPGEQYFFKVYTSNPDSNLTFNVCIVFPDPVVAVSDTEYTIEELVTDVLVGNPCLISNMSWSTGTNFGKGNGIAYFNKNNSTFEFEDGIVLTTGDFTAVPGPSSQNTTTGGSWDGDDDLLDYMQNAGLIVDQYNDASILEFDFIPTKPDFSFDFIFASNEYGQYQCDFSDAFAFFLTDLTTNNVTNLALVPGTNAPISVTTIRNELHSPVDFDTGLPSCTNANESYFDKCFDPDYNGLDPFSAPINAKGYTVPLTAQAIVVPGNTYHIKMIIANRNDSQFDSSVFLLGRSFDIGQIDLGKDLTIATNNALCSGQSHTLEAQIDTSFFNIKWYKDDEIIVGQNSPVLVVQEPGNYKIEAIFNQSDCSIVAEIKVEFYPDFITQLKQPMDLAICKDVEMTIDLTTVESEIFENVNRQDFSIEYYNSIENLENEINKISDVSNYDVSNGNHIFLKIIDQTTLCSGTMSFVVEIFEIIPIPEFVDLETCNYYQLPNLPSGITYHSAPNGGGIQYKSGEILKKGNYKIYLLSQNEICFEESDFNVKVIDCIIPKGISPNNDNLNDTFDLAFYNVQRIKIYNRHGVEVYDHGPGYTNQWIGQGKNGNSLPSGTYFYVIETPFENFTGWVQLIREIK